MKHLKRSYSNQQPKSINAKSFKQLVKQANNGTIQATVIKSKKEDNKKIVRITYTDTKQTKQVSLSFGQYDTLRSGIELKSKCHMEHPTSRKRRYSRVWACRERSKIHRFCVKPKRMVIQRPVKQPIPVDEEADGGKT